MKKQGKSFAAKHAAWEKTPAGKRDEAMDKKLGIKEDSPRDMKIDKAAMAKGKR